METPWPGSGKNGDTVGWDTLGWDTLGWDTLGGALELKHFGCEKIKSKHV